MVRTKQGYDEKDAVIIQDAENIKVMMGNDEVVGEECRWSRDASGRLRYMVTTSSTW